MRERSNANSSLEDKKSASPDIDCSDCAARNGGVCGPFDGALLSALSGVSKEITLKRGGLLAAAGAASTAMYVVKAGELKAVRNLPDGRHHIVGFISPGDGIGGPYAEITHDCTIQALTDAVLCKFERQELEKIARRRPELILRLLAAAFGELRQRSDQAVLLGRKNADERVASFLVGRLQQTDGRSDGDHTTLPMSRLDIADHLGLTIETVSRIVSQFKRRGLVRISQNKYIEAADIDGLKTIAGGEVAAPNKARIFV